MKVKNKIINPFNLPPGTLMDNDYIHELVADTYARWSKNFNVYKNGEKIEVSKPVLTYTGEMNEECYRPTKYDR